MKSQHVDTLARAVNPLWTQIKALFAEHHFITIVCGFFAILMILSCYRFLRSISPALVSLFLLIILFILILHWTQTRSEPAFLKPMMDWLSAWLPRAADYKR